MHFLGNHRQILSCSKISPYNPSFLLVRMHTLVYLRNGTLYSMHVTVINYEHLVTSVYPRSVFTINVQYVVLDSYLETNQVLLFLNCKHCCNFIR